PKTIACAKHLSLHFVPDGEGKHPVELREAVSSVCGIGRQNHFRVRLGAEVIPAADEFLFQFDIVVDLAVVGDRVAPQVMHRLGRRVAEVDDGEPTMSKANASAWIHPMSGPVWPTMNQLVCHSSQNL